MSLFTGIDLVPGSGCGLLFKGDLGNDDWLIEIKSTRNEKLKLDIDWWEKANRQADEKHKPNCALILGWDERPDDYEGSHLHFVIYDDGSEPDNSEDVPTVNLKHKVSTIHRDLLEGIGAEITTKSFFRVFHDGKYIGKLMPLSGFIKTCLSQS